MRCEFLWFKCAHQLLSFVVKSDFIVYSQTTFVSLCWWDEFIKMNEKKTTTLPESPHKWEKKPPSFRSHLNFVFDSSYFQPIFISDFVSSVAALFGMCFKIKLIISLLHFHILHVENNKMKRQRQRETLINGCSLKFHNDSLIIIYSFFFIIIIHILSLSLSVVRETEKCF